MVFCARLVACQEQAGSLAFDEVPRRLAKQLLQLSLLPESRPEKGGVQLNVSLTHEELAKLVHTTRENLTAIMNRFRRLGLLEYGQREFVVFPDRLSDYLNE
ncbi:MAG: winged helix-turn-helix domain-containing protein [Acidobacteria bacterium]|nr:winged helix-turn-helix domain-containing protein [Acidobacteriota bacterium]